MSDNETLSNLPQPYREQSKFETTKCSYMGNLVYSNKIATTIKERKKIK
jgi:hypothetical protein